LEPVGDLSKRFPWVDTLGTKPSKWLSGKPGFAVAAGGRKVVSSWLLVRRHVCEGHGPRAWADFLHAVTTPCLVLEQPKKKEKRRTRLAMYRLGPGKQDAFRMAIVEQFDEQHFFVVTAFARPSIRAADAAGIGDSRPPTCRAFALRQRDLDPETTPRPRRWSMAEMAPPNESCCEHLLDCSRPSAP